MTFLPIFCGMEFVTSSQPSGKVMPKFSAANVRSTAAQSGEPVQRKARAKHHGSTRKRQACRFIGGLGRIGAIPTRNRGAGQAPSSEEEIDNSAGRQARLLGKDPPNEPKRVSPLTTYARRPSLQRV